MVTKKYCWLMLLLAIILEITGTALMKFFAIKGGMEGYILMLLFIFIQNPLDCYLLYSIKLSRKPFCLLRFSF